MSFELTTLDEADYDWVRALYYGEPGSGKTSAAAAACRLGKVIYVDSEAGLKVRALRSIEPPLPVDQIDVLKVPSREALSSLVDTLREQHHDGELEYKTIVFDSITELAGDLNLEAVRLRQVEAEERGMEVSDEIEMEDYQSTAGFLKKLIRDLKTLPLHVVFVALPKREVDDDGEVNYVPAGSPAVVAALLGAVDVTGQFFTVDGGKDGPSYRARFAVSEKWIVKDRFHALPKVLVDASLDRVVAYVNGELDVSNDPVMQAAIAAKKAQKDE